MEAIEDALVTLVISVVIGGLIKLYLDYKTKLSGALWKKRLDACLVFVKLTTFFPKYPKKEIIWRDVYSLSLNFRDWYFNGAG